MKNETKLKRLAIIISIVLPIAVAILFGVKIEGIDLSFLPSFYATINGITAIVLVLAYVAIKKKKAKPRVSGSLTNEKKATATPATKDPYRVAVPLPTWSINQPTTCMAMNPPTPASISNNPRVEKLTPVFCSNERI